MIDNGYVSVGPKPKSDKDFGKAPYYVEVLNQDGTVSFRGTTIEFAAKNDIANKSFNRGAEFARISEEISKRNQTVTICGLSVTALYALPTKERDAIAIEFAKNTDWAKKA